MVGMVLGARRVQDETQTSTPSSQSARAQILAPFVIGDVNLGGRVERVDANLAIAAQHDGPDVAGRNFVGSHQFHRRLAEFVERVSPRRCDRSCTTGAGAACGRAGGKSPGPSGLVAANAFKDRRAVVDHVGHHVDALRHPRESVARCATRSSLALMAILALLQIIGVVHLLRCGPDVQTTEDAHSESQRCGDR